MGKSLTYEEVKKEFEKRGFNIIKKHDKIKNIYCLKNNIRLLRIPYWEFDNIEAILEEALFKNNSVYFIA